MDSEVPVFVGADEKGKIEFIKLPTDFKDRVLNQAGSETDCGKKIVQLIDTLDSDTRKDKFEQSKKDKKKKRSYIESLFNRVDGSIKQDKKASHFTAGTGSEDYYHGGAKVSFGFAPTDIIGSKNFGQIKNIDDLYDRYVNVFLHELVHTASKDGRYTDQEVLRAVISILKADGKSAPEYTDDTRIASTRINDFFGEYCPLPKR